MLLRPPRARKRDDGQPAQAGSARLDEVGEGEEGLFGQRLPVRDDTARLGVADDPLRVDEGHSAAREDRLQVASAALAPDADIVRGVVAVAACVGLHKGVGEIRGTAPLPDSPSVLEFDDCAAPRSAQSTKGALDDLGGVLGGVTGGSCI